MQRISIILLTVFVLANLTACSGEKSKDNEVKQDTPAPVAAVEPKKDAPKPPTDEAAKDAAKVLNPIAAGMEAPEGDTPCEQAYNSFKKMFDAMTKMHAAKPGAETPEMPTKEDFTKGCLMLPENLQKCMSLHYATGHKEECIKAKMEVDPAVMAKANVLLGPKKKK